MTSPAGTIEVDGLTKRYGPVTALDDLSFTVRPGHVTGFLGPNGAGKTTTMRIILGLAAPTSGRALVGGRRYDALIRPLREVGSLLDATALHGGRTAWMHLVSVARSNGIPRPRITEVLRLTGLEAVANRRVKGFSLGMKQRLGIAAALLGDPPVLMFDEPVNGLDPEGVWSLLVAVVTPIGVSTVVAVAFASAPASGGQRPDPLLPEVVSLEYAVIAVSVLGVLAFSAEYSTGLIRTTFAAAPRRRAVLAAKAVVLGAVTLAAGELVAFASFFGVQAVLAGHHQGVSLSRPGVPGAVLAAGLLLCVCTLLGLALGSIIRHTAGGIAATIAVILLPGILGVLPPPWNGRISRFALLEAAQQVTALHPAANLFSPGLSLLVLLAWPVAALAVAAVLITRRDT